MTDAQTAPAPGLVDNGPGIWAEAHPPNWRFGEWDLHHNFYLAEWRDSWNHGRERMRELYGPLREAIQVAAVGTPSEDVVDMVDREMGMYWQRKPLIERFGYAIPWSGALEAIRDAAAGRGVLELGAGAGYWARCLRAFGVAVRAVEPLPDERTHKQRTGFWHPVEERAEPAAALDEGPSGRLAPVLFLCWPGMEPWATAALERFRGDTVAYVGEWQGCCADDAFFHALDRDWEETAHAPLPQWPGIHDRCWIYRRRRPTAAGRDPGRLPG